MELVELWEEDNCESAAVDVNLLGMDDDRRRRGTAAR